jgi:hypothetical protein
MPSNFMLTLAAGTKLTCTDAVKSQPRRAANGHAHVSSRCAWSRPRRRCCRAARLSPTQARWSI